MGGYADWRVPTVLELVSLIDFTKESPAIDTDAFPDTPAAEFFASLSEPWNVRFSDGATLISDVPFVRQRCVRSTGQGRHCWPPGGRYQILAGGLVTDRATQLTWQQQLSGAVTWSEAQMFCAGLVGGFRLPSFKELQTIVSYQVETGDRVDLTAFPGTPQTAFWTSTTPPLGNEAWVVSLKPRESRTSHYTTRTVPTNDLYPARCVR